MHRVNLIWYKSFWLDTELTTGTDSCHFGPTVGSPKFMRRGYFYRFHWYYL